MAMRRISWIDQRISDGVVMLWLLPGATFRFFERWRITIQLIARIKLNAGLGGENLKNSSRPLIRNPHGGLK
jgi:hypothetical protein